jgi:hypothetical protein
MKRSKSQKCLSWITIKKRSLESSHNSYRQRKQRKSESSRKKSKKLRKNSSARFA